MKNTTINLHAGSRNSVLHEFAKRLDITPMEIIQQNKKSEISDVRHLYYKLRYDRHGVSFSALGRELGRDPSTVRYGVRRIENLLSLQDERIVELWHKVRDISEMALLALPPLLPLAARADL